MSLLPPGKKTDFCKWLDEQKPPMDGIESVSALRGWNARDEEIVIHEELEGGLGKSLHAAEVEIERLKERVGELEGKTEMTDERLPCGCFGDCSGHGVSRAVLKSHRRKVLDD